MKIKHFISNLDMFPLISQMIFYINELTLILKIIGQCDVKHIMMLPFKTITWVLKVLTYYTITSIAACPTRLAMILVIMSVSTFQTDIILQNVYTNNSIIFPLWRINILLYSGINIVIFFLCWDRCYVIFVSVGTNGMGEILSHHKI
jgi:hypothetical protein